MNSIKVITGMLILCIGLSMITEVKAQGLNITDEQKKEIEKLHGKAD